MTVRKPDSHKGENGKVTIIGGSKNYTGAPVISAMAAYRTGADLVKLLVPEQNREITASQSPELIIETYPGDSFNWEGVDKATDLLEWADASVIGPGGGSGDFSHLEDYADEAVVDAEAIKDLAEAAAIITPHHGELDVLGREAMKFAEEHDTVVAVTGKQDRVYYRGKKHEIARGDPTMTVGGTGDMLTGIIAGLKAQGVEDEEAALKGLRIAGAAGERAAQKYVNGALPSDMIEEIPAAMKQIGE